MPDKVPLHPVTIAIMAAFVHNQRVDAITKDFAQAMDALKPTEVDAMTPSYCGSLITMGHGDNARCGDLYWDEVYQCDKCKIKDLERAMKAPKDDKPKDKR